MTALTMIAGVVLGWLASLIAQWFYLVLLFPIGIGIVLGGVAMFGIKLGKIRNSLFAGLAGLIGGCMAMLSMHYFDYQRAVAQMAKEQPQLHQIWVQNKLNFADFMHIQAEEGVELSRAGRGDKGLNLGYIGSVIYWLVEVGIVAVLAFIMARAGAAEPFCTQCQNWKEDVSFGLLDAPGDAAFRVLGSGETGRLAEFPQGGATLVGAGVCPGCKHASSIDVQVQEARTNDKGEVQMKSLGRVTYPGAALPIFEAIFAQAAEPPAGPGAKPQA